MKITKVLSIITVAALAALPFGRVTAAPDEVVIGVIYPLSGPVAQAGIDAVAAINTALEIINGESDLNVPLAKGKGLPNLGGVDRCHGVDAGLGHWPAERIDDADDDLVRGSRHPTEGQSSQRGNGDN